METILVIDHSDRLLERARERLPRIAVVESEGALGLSGARNTGVRAAHADIVAFLDDDASAAPNWLDALVTEFSSPNVVGVGGLTEPRWPAGKKPSWLPEEFYWTVGCSYLGLPGNGAPIRNPIGANMAFRREAMLEAGGFPEGIGRVGTVPLGCEETELAIHITRSRHGARIVYSLSARVEHSVDPSRVSLRYFVSRCWAEGKSKAAIEAHVGRADGLASERHYVAHTLPAGIARGLMDASRGQLAGLARAAAIVLGLTVTVCGYSIGLLGRRADAAIVEEGT